MVSNYVHVLASLRQDICALLPWSLSRQTGLKPGFVLTEQREKDHPDWCFELDDPPPSQSRFFELCWTGHVHFNEVPLLSVLPAFVIVFICVMRMVLRACYRKPILLFRHVPTYTNVFDHLGHYQKQSVSCCEPLSSSIKGAFLRHQIKMDWNRKGHSELNKCLFLFCVARHFATVCTNEYKPCVAVAPHCSVQLREELTTSNNYRISFLPRLEPVVCFPCRCNPSTLTGSDNSKTLSAPPPRTVVFIRSQTGESRLKKGGTTWICPIQKHLQTI